MRQQPLRRSVQIAIVSVKVHSLTAETMNACLVLVSQRYLAADNKHVIDKENKTENVKYENRRAHGKSIVEKKVICLALFGSNTFACKTTKSTELNTDFGRDLWHSVTLGAFTTKSSLN